MKKLILIICLFFSIIGVTNAIPLPAIVLGYDFFIFIIPAIFSFLGIIYFYFRKYINIISIIIFLLTTLLYIYHIFYTKEFIFYYFDIGFLIFYILFFFIVKNKIFIFLNFIILIIFFFFLIKLDYNIFVFKKIYNCILYNNYNNLEITNYLIKDNFIVIYFYDLNTKDFSSSIIERSSYLNKEYINYGNYFIRNGGKEQYGKYVFSITKNCIK